MENVNEWKNLYGPSIYNVSGKQLLPSLIEHYIKVVVLTNVYVLQEKELWSYPSPRGSLYIYISERKI